MGFKFGGALGGLVGGLFGKKAGKRAGKAQQTAAGQMLARTPWHYFSTNLTDPSGGDAGRWAGEMRGLTDRSVADRQQQYMDAFRAQQLGQADVFADAMSRAGASRFSAGGASGVRRNPDQLGQIGRQGALKNLWMQGASKYAQPLAQSNAAEYAYGSKMQDLRNIFGQAASSDAANAAWAGGESAKARASMMPWSGLGTGLNADLSRMYRKG